MKFKISFETELNERELQEIEDADLTPEEYVLQDLYAYIPGNDEAITIERIQEPADPNQDSLL